MSDLKRHESGDMLKIVGLALLFDFMAASLAVSYVANVQGWRGWDSFSFFVLWGIFFTVGAIIIAILVGIAGLVMKRREMPVAT